MKTLIALAALAVMPVQASTTQCDQAEDKVQCLKVNAFANFFGFSNNASYLHFVEQINHLGQNTYQVEFFGKDAQALLAIHQRLNMGMALNEIEQLMLPQYAQALDFSLAKYLGVPQDQVASLLLRFIDYDKLHASLHVLQSPSIEAQTALYLKTANIRSCGELCPVYQLPLESDSIQYLGIQEFARELPLLSQFVVQIGEREELWINRGPAGPMQLKVLKQGCGLECNQPEQTHF